MAEYLDPALLHPSIPRLKKHTLYRCPDGHSSRWTGELHFGQAPDSHLCRDCGQQLEEVGEGTLLYRVSWEARSMFVDLARREFIYGDVWHPMNRTSSDLASVRGQYSNLLELSLDEGPVVRNVKVERSTIAWEPLEL